MSNVAAGKDIDDNGENLNDVEKALNKQGIALRSAKGEWRSFEDVIDEVAKKWRDGTFNGIQKSQIATAIAGVRQQENFRAMMNNWEEVERLTKVAADSTGSATERMDIYLDSVEAKTNNLKAAWEQFVMSLNQSESWKQLLDWLTKFLEKLQYVDWKMVGTIATIGGIITVILKLIPALKTLYGVIKAGGLIAGISSGGIVPLLGLIATAILSIASAWKSANDNAEQQIESIKKQKDELDEERDTVLDLAKTYNDLKSKQGVYGLTADEKQKLVDVSKELVEKYGLEYDGIDSLTGAYKIASGAINEYTDAVERQQKAYTQEQQDARRKDIDSRLEKLSWKDLDYETANSYRNMGKDFDSNLYYSYNKEKESIVSSIQEQMMGIISKDISDTSKKVVLDQIKDSTSTMNAYEIKGKFTDDYLSKLNDFATEYDSFISKMSKSEEQYSSIIEKNGVLSLSQVKEYKNALEDKLAIYKKMQEDGLITENEFNNQVSKLEGEINSRLDFSLQSISESLGDNAGAFNDVASNVLNFTSQLKKGEQSISEYVTSVAELSESLDLKEVFGDNTESAVQFFSTLSTQLTNVLNLIKSQYESGEYKSNNDYINDLISWGQSIERIGNKMSTIDGAKKDATGDSSIQNDNRIAVVKKDGKVSYIMNENTFEQERNIQNKLTDIKSIYDGLHNAQEVDYDALFKLTGNPQLRNQKGYDYFYDKANEHKANGEGYGITDNDYFEYLKNNLDNGEEVVNRFKNILAQEKQLETEQEKINLWNNATNKYNETNTNIIQADEEVINKYQTQIDTLKKQKDNLQNEYNDIRDNKSVLSFNPKQNILEGKKKDLFGWDFIDDEAKNSALNKKQKEIDDVNSKIEEYEKKIDDARNSENSFEKAVKDANAEIQNQDSSVEEMASATKDISDAIKGLKELQDSISAIEGINSGTIVEGSAEFGAAIETIATDVYNSVRDTSGNIKQEYIDIYGETSALFSGTVDDLVAAYQNGEITIEQFEAVLKQSVQDNINKLKNGIGDFLIGVGKQFEDFQVTLKITMNTGNIADKLKNAIAGITGQDINVGEIKIASDAASNTLSTLGNAIKNTPLEFDFSYMPKDTNNFGGKGSGKNSPNGYSPSGGGSKKGSGSDYSAEDAANDLKDILNDIEKYEEDIELDLEDQTEQFINQEMLAANRLDTLKEELDYYNDIYDVTENTSKWLETQNKLLDNQSKKVGSLQNAQASIDAQRKKIIKQNSNYNVESWFDSENNDTLAYGDLINSFEYKKEAIERDTAAKMRAVYNRVSGSKDKDTIKNAKDEIKRIEEEADIKIKAIDKEREKVEKVHDSVGELNDAWKDNQEAIRDTLKELHDLVKSMRDELLDDITEQLEKAVDRTNKSLEKSVTRMEQLVTIQEKSNDILNETIDTQQELDSELQASLDSFEYLDEQMRELMFNEDDYKVLSETLTGIQNDVASIWEDHYKQIDELTDDTMYKAEYITAETERQLDMKMREYELAKAELDVAKARTNLQNVKNERNVRMFVGGQWIWTADPNAVKDAQQQLADAEREKNRIEREAEQQRLLDKMNKMIDSDNLQIDENNELLERIQEAIEEQTTEVKSIEDALANASGQDLPALNDVLQGAFGKDGGDFKEIMTNLNKGQTALAAALDGKTTEQAEAQLKRNDMSKSEFEALVKKLGYGWDEKTGTVTTWDGSFKAHYKGWKDTSKPNTPLGTGSNGASVTGGGANGGSSGGGNSGGGNNQPTSTKSLDAIAKEVIRGKWGNGTERRRRLTAAGYDYNAVQSVVNQLKRQGYFDLGGLATGKGILLKDVKSPERVLSPQQTKSFDRLVDNLTSNPVLQALTKNVKGTSSLKGLVGGSGETKQYYFSNFTVKADNLTEFIDSLEGMIPIANK